MRRTPGGFERCKKCGYHVSINFINPYTFICSDCDKGIVQEYDPRFDTPRKNITKKRRKIND